MQIPRYWAEASAPAKKRSRHRVNVRRWGWSDDSPAAAQAHAQQRLQEALACMGKPGEPRARESHPRGYNGADGLPICEEILDTRGSAVLTRNSYGAHCLNTPDVLFADVDYANRYKGLGMGGVIVLLFLCGIGFMAGWASTAYAIGLALVMLLLFSAYQNWAHRPAVQHRRALRRIRSFVRQHPDWGLRVYQTPAGLRVLVTHQPFMPGAPEVLALFDALRVDPLYRRMCQVQQCFRARVSAKPWRMGIRSSIMPNVRIKWPVPPQYAQHRATWVAAYEKAARQYAACRLVESLGRPEVDPGVQVVLDWHDALSQARSALPLA
ncbi:MAG: hypothetical protein Q4A98_09810 [Comamonadaceae bacterium]|nr:hypothetical protein [Comamonadaceae bacterium]